MRSLTPWSMWMMNWSPTWKLNGGNGYTLNATRSHKAQKTQMFKARQILQFVSFYVIIHEVCNWLTSVLCGRSITFTRLSEVNSEGKIDLAPWRTKHFTILEFSFNLPFWSTPIFWNSLDISIYIQLLNNDVLGLWNQQKSCQRSSCVIAASWILSGTCQALHLASGRGNVDFLGMLLEALVSNLLFIALLPLWFNYQIITVITLIFWEFIRLKWFNALRRMSPWFTSNHLPHQNPSCTASLAALNLLHRDEQSFFSRVERGSCGRECQNSLDREGAQCRGWLRWRLIEIESWNGWI